MADTEKADAITGLSGLPATITKLGMAGTILLMLAWKVMYSDPEERREARKHGEQAVQGISASMERQTDATDRNTQMLWEMQTRTHANQLELIELQKKKPSGK